MALEFLRVKREAYIKYPCTLGFKAVVLPRAPLSSRVLPLTCEPILGILVFGEAWEKAILRVRIQSDPSMHDLLFLSSG